MGCSPAAHSLFPHATLSSREPRMRSPSLVREQGLILFTILVSFWLMCGSAPAQTVSTWSGGAGNWSDCPPRGNALWDTCPDPPQGKGWPNGDFDAVINGRPPKATPPPTLDPALRSGAPPRIPA